MTYLRPIFALLACSLLLGAAACENTIRGVGDDVEETVDAVDGDEST